jgi:FkbM family methyltransferase
MALKRWIVRTRELWTDAQRFRHAFRNYTTAMLHAAMHNYPFTAVLKDGNQVVITDPIHAYHVSGYAERGWKYESSDDTVIVPESEFGRSIRFRAAGHNGDLMGIASGELMGLDVREKTVLDVGTNIGDSAVYFALRGARRVIGLEPYPAVFALAQENVRLNDLESIIQLHRIGLSGQDGEVMLDSKTQSTGRIRLEPSIRGERVKLMGIPSLIKTFRLEQGSVLKIDCEGCEYEALASVDESALSLFSQILIEYHYGIRELQSRLRSAGFEVTTSRQRMATLPSGRIMDVGLVQADRMRSLDASAQS